MHAPLDNHDLDNALAVELARQVVTASAEHARLFRQLGDSLRDISDRYADSHRLDRDATFVAFFAAYLAAPISTGDNHEHNLANPRRL